MDALKKDLKAAEISEDEEKDLEAEVQTITDSFVKKIDLAIEDKTKELMTV
jgi:ribosome recycling factor